MTKSFRGKTDIGLSSPQPSEMILELHVQSLGPKYVFLFLIEAITRDKLDRDILCNFRFD